MDPVKDSFIYSLSAFWQTVYGTILATIGIGIVFKIPKLLWAFLRWIFIDYPNLKEEMDFLRINLRKQDEVLKKQDETLNHIQKSVNDIKEFNIKNFHGNGQRK